MGATGNTFTTRNPNGAPEKYQSVTKMASKPIRGTAASTVTGEKATGSNSLADGSKSQTTRVIKNKKEEKDKKDKAENAES